MRAGTGVRHSEYNGSKSEAVHFLQIWVVPDRDGLAPRYDQRAFDAEAARRGLLTLAAPGGGDGAIEVRQDLRLLVARLGEGDERVHPLAAGRHAWVHVARGAVELNGRPLDEGDGAALSQEEAVRLSGRGDAEVLVFDLA